MGESGILDEWMMEAGSQTSNCFPDDPTKLRLFTHPNTHHDSKHTTY